jgi:hypothetical protein
MKITTEIILSWNPCPNYTVARAIAWEEHLQLIRKKLAMEKEKTCIK